MTTMTDMNMQSIIDKFTDIHLPGSMGKNLEAYRMHDVITVGADKLKTYQGTVSFCGWVCIICLCVSAYFAYNYNLFGSLFPLPFLIFFLWAYLLFKRLNSNLVFDYANGMYHYGVITDELKIDPKKHGPLSDIEQLTVINKRNAGQYDKHSGNHGRDFSSYRLEMKLVDDSKRLIMHRMHSGNVVYAIAAHLAQRIGVPAYGPDGLLQVSEKELSKYKPTKSLRLSIDEREEDTRKNFSWLSIILLATILLAGGTYLIQNRYINEDATPYVSETLNPEVLENYIKSFYATRLDEKFVMTAIEKMLIVPIDEEDFEIHVRYRFAPSRPESGIGYTGSDQRVFMGRINSANQSAANISILSMGKNNSADFVIGKLKKSFKKKR